MRPRPVLATAALLLVAACSTDNGPASPSGVVTLEAASVGPLTGTPGWVMDQPLKVLLKDADGMPMVGVDIHFTSATPHGSNSSTETPYDQVATTDSLGFASHYYWPGWINGTDLVVASGANKTVQFSIQTSSFGFDEAAGVNYRWCMLANGGTLYCSGVGFPKSVPSSLTLRERPVAANTTLRFHGLSGSGSTWCALDTGKQLYCWNNTNFGPAGTATENVATPQLITTPMPFEEIIVGSNRQDVTASANTGLLICGLDADHHAWCKGKYAGNGSLAVVPDFVAVSGGVAFRQLSLASASACGVDMEGLAWCWADYEKRLGVANTATIVTVPTRVGGTRHYSRVVFVSGGVCGIEELTSDVYCWGTMWGALTGQTNGTSGNNGFTALPLSIQGGLKASFIDSGTGNDARVFEAGSGNLKWWGDAYPGREAVSWEPVTMAGSAMAPLGSGSHYWCGRPAGVAVPLLCSKGIGERVAIPVPQ